MYSTVMQLKNEPPQELLELYEQGSFTTFRGLPGMVAFDLANVIFDEQQGDTSTFLNKYRVQMDHLSTTPYQINKEWDLKTDLLDEAIRMKGFIENILLSVPLNYPALAKVSRHKRVAVYIKTNKLSDIIEHRFKKVRIYPFFFSEKSIDQKMDSEEIEKYYSKIKRKLIKNIHDDKALKEFSKFFSFAWKYESNDILDIGWLELLLLAQEDISVKNCKHCQEFFIPSPPNTLHCLKCRDNYTPQELYRYRKIEGMSEKEKESARKWRRLYMQKYRSRKKEEEKEKEKKIQEESRWKNL